MEQENLFHEDIYDALRTCIQRIGGNKKAGSSLWPEKSPDKAGEMLANCLNRDHAQKLDLEQVLWILRKARQKGCHAGMYFITDECDYRRPEPITKAERKVSLFEKIALLGDEVNQLLDEAKRLSE